MRTRGGFYGGVYVVYLHSSFRQEEEMNPD
jgi:hypothetical protein